MAARKFYQELFETYDSLAEIADQHGALTLADIVYLSSAILSGDGYVDHSFSDIKEVVSAMPSADQWVTFLHDGPKSSAKPRY